MHVCMVCVYIDTHTHTHVCVCTYLYVGSSDTQRIITLLNVKVELSCQIDTESQAQGTPRRRHNRLARAHCCAPVLAATQDHINSSLTRLSSLVRLGTITPVSPSTAFHRLGA